MNLREHQRRESQKLQVREKVGKSQNTVSPMVCGSGRLKRRLAKAAGAEPPGQMSDDNLHAVVAQAHLQLKKLEALHVRCSSGS